MNGTRKLFVLVLSGVLLTSGTAFACYSHFFDEVYASVIGQKLDKSQMRAIQQFKQDFAVSKRQDHSQGLCDADHDRHVPKFIASAAGVLDDAQFAAVMNREKTETEKLRYEIFRLKEELAEIKALVEALKQR
ncbi:MAG: hypothetical protein ACO4CW_04770 [Planctomycetota bacterium]